MGAQRDVLIRDEGANINREWDGIWTVRTQRTGEGWTAEIAIPFRTLRFSNLENQTWGVNFGRSVARKREESFWTPILRSYGYMGRMKISYFGHLTGLSGLEQGEKLQVMPYVIGGGNKEEAAAPFRGKADAGLDLKYRLTSNLTADLTVNTDFAQVESDQEQFNLTPYSLFFPEKREFFLEGADIFRFGERAQEHDMPTTLLFFSRSIGLSEDGKEVPVLGGARVTGKAGRYDIGVLDILSGRTSYVNDDGEFVDIGRANASVVRIKRDIFEKSSIGIIGMSKDPLDGGRVQPGDGPRLQSGLRSGLQDRRVPGQDVLPRPEEQGLGGGGQFELRRRFLGLRPLLHGHRGELRFRARDSCPGRTSGRSGSTPGSGRGRASSASARASS